MQNRASDILKRILTPGGWRRNGWFLTDLSFGCWDYGIKMISQLANWLIFNISPDNSKKNLSSLQK